MNSKFSLYLVILTLLLDNGVQSMRILPRPVVRRGVEFYDSINFKGLIWQGPPTPHNYQQNCTILPELGKAKASSLKTTNCIIAFSDDSCQTSENHPSFSFAPGNYPNLMEITHQSQNADNIIRSFQQCTSDVCNNGVHVELYKGLERKEKLVEYFNMNNCTDLPEYAVKNVDALDNHGNCVELYDAVDCNGKSVKIRGGVSQESLNLKHANFAGNAISIGPCANVTACNVHVPLPPIYSLDK